MTPEQAKSMYRRQLRPFGTVAVRRYTSSSEPRTYVDYTALGRLFEATADALAGDIKQRNSRAIVLAEDLVTAGLSGEVTASDVLVVRGKVYRIVNPDVQTRRIGDVLIAYEFEVRG